MQKYTPKTTNKPINLNDQDIVRFWAKVAIVAQNDCWQWQAASSKGYGVFKIKNIQMYAQRVAYTIEYGAIPDGLVIMHKCDNPLCVNPKHLQAGTTNDNVQDRNRKDRQAKGEKSGPAVLSESDIPIIRQLYADGMNGRQIAKKLSVGKSTIYYVLNKSYWKHVK